MQLRLWNAITALKDDTAQTGFWVRLLVTVALGAWLVWAKLVVQLWLKPAKTRSHFSSQGLGGPPPIGCYEDGKAIYQLQNQQIVFAAESFGKFFIPGYRFLPTMRNRRIWKIDREVRMLTMRLIQKKMDSLKDGGVVDEIVPRDLLEQMIMESLKEKGGDGLEIKVRDIVEECKSFFFAGKNTTSSLLVWTTVSLAMHPQWQLLAREEVLRVCGASGSPKNDHLANLSTLGMIINEALRLYTPVLATIRRTKAGVEIGGYKLPKRTELFIPNLAVHHDPDVWGADVHEFNPARFSHGVAQAAKYPTAFMPFGIGATQCIGKNLVILEAKLAMAIILQRFSFELSPEYKHAPTVSMFLYPQFNAPILVQKL